MSVEGGWWVARLRASISALSPRREDYFLLPFHIQSLRSEVEGCLSDSKCKMFSIIIIKTGEM